MDCPHCKTPLFKINIHQHFEAEITEQVGAVVAKIFGDSEKRIVYSHRQREAYQLGVGNRKLTGITFSCCECRGSFDPATQGWLTKEFTVGGSTLQEFCLVADETEMEEKL